MGALFGIGVLHGLHRPLQSLLLPHAGAGRLMARLLPAPALKHLDTTAHRLELPRLGAETAQALSPWARTRVMAYLMGLKQGLHRGKPPFGTRQVVRLLGVPSPEDLCSGFLLSSYLGLSEGQERMERLLAQAVGEGAEPRLLESMFAPHLQGWDPEQLAQLPRVRPSPGFAAHSLAGVGGSNAWAVTGGQTASGTSILAGDPHLQINQMPALFYEVRVRLPDNYWIGATIPGLPGLAVGRNRDVAWTGTFSVADNVDHFIEDPKFAGVRDVRVGRRFFPDLNLTFRETKRGTLESDHPDAGLACRWSGPEKAHEALQAYLRLPACDSTPAAEVVLRDAHTLSLHFVLADKASVSYRQVGRIPRRTQGWSGLWPSPQGGPEWNGTLDAADLPAFHAAQVVSANEARPGRDGVTLSTLAQPDYRRRRIQQLLAASRTHDLGSMKAIQQDLYSRQAALLLPLLMEVLPAGPLRQTLEGWDCIYRPQSRAASAFALVYRAALSALAVDLGGAWFEDALNRSEVSVWWCTALDRALLGARQWPEHRKRVLSERLRGLARVTVEPWGEMQRLALPHLVFGGLPEGFGYDRGSYALPGSVATVSQGNLLRLGDARVAVGPAYRFVTDLGTDYAETSLPGGIDGDPRSDSYDCYLDAHMRGEYHRLVPPQPDEADWFIAEA